MSKKSVVTITVMACLLAVAVATTIVLAAFSANKTATTTIQFTNGVKIQIDGAYVNGEASPGTADTPSIGGTTLLWACTEGTRDKNTTSNSLTDVSSAVVFDAISFTNGSASQSTVAWLIAKPTITCTVGTGTSDAPTTEQAAAATTAMTTALANIATNKWIAIGSTGWYAYSEDSTNITGSSLTALPTGTTMKDLAVGATADFLASTTLTYSPIEKLAGATYEATVQVFAVNKTASDAISALNAVIAASLEPQSP